MHTCVVALGIDIEGAKYPLAIEDWAFRCEPGSGASDPARIAREDLALFDSGREDRAEQPLCLGRHGHRRAAAQ